jgi:thiamine pyrophosphate-dependent acetolactate synthase large subunit-like protein
MPPTQPAAARHTEKPATADNSIGALERPRPAGVNAPAFGSDVVAETLHALQIPYIAVTPGASYRGLHDSIVNYLGNAMPQMLLCVHEEAAVAIAHGYAKVTGKAMAAAVHSNVGLQHATMAVFNAWCDRMPVLVLGATGPVDAAKRRPWIDWIHTARDQGALVREYTKWDDQPASPAAAREALMRGTWIAETAPQGPVYINLDAEMQEAKLAEQLPPLDAARYMPPIATAAPADLIEQAAAMLKSAKQVVMLAGRASRSEDAWNARVALAEALNASVVTDLKIGASFPTDHPLHAGAPRDVTPDSVPGIRNADVILSLDWVDLAGCALWAPRPRQRSFRPRSTIASTTAGAWITKRCRRSICSCPPIPTLSYRNSSKSSARKAESAASRASHRRRAQALPRTSRRALPTSRSPMRCAKFCASGR